jgi:cbb3-type cytochrome oxidase cytochrome c subunit
MAATDQNYRTQHTLDIVFAISSLAMLLSVVWMFADDYYRPYKVEQRDFRNVESALAQRMALDQIPDKAEFEAKRTAFDEARAAYEAKKDELRSLKAQRDAYLPEKQRADATYQTINADRGSIASFYVIAKEHNDDKAAKKYADQLVKLDADLVVAQAKVDDLTVKMKEKEVLIDAIEQPVTKTQSEWKKVTDKFDAQVKLAYYKQWGWGDWFRALPIIDGFASPVKIQQITNNDIPIDYNFKQVTRFDRCTTCHLGIDRPAYTKDNLRSLATVTDKQRQKIDEAHAMLDERTKAFAGLPEGSKLPTSGYLKLNEVSPSVLTTARISEYAAHPRLDLFVGANSKHPVEKFGCSSCHSGQGSATEFTLAAHTPNAAPEKKRWVQEHGWEAQHMWDFPMLPQRFIESSCLKCHHQVTDLISSDNRVEAPKLLRGYNLIKENGCFGCHEIAGTKAGKEIGPDLRLEPYPPLEELSDAETNKIEFDTENPPGTLRKVGPSLFRVSEKTNLEWAVQWIRAPRGFRPDTKMPHFYGTTNNSREVREKHAPEQKDFPDVEIRAVAHYLFKASDKYVAEIAAQHKADAGKPGADQADATTLLDLLAKGKDKLSKTEADELAAIRWRTKLRREKVLTDLAPKHEGDPAEGRRLFTEKGCLACHSHDATEKTAGAVGQANYVPAVKGEAQFGPNLSQVKVKLGKTAGDKKSARTWLIQWISDPHVHSPRSRMPITHMSPANAADIAAWLLDQPATDLGKVWQKDPVPEPDEAKLQDLARVYLVRLLAKSDIEALFKDRKLEKVVVNDLPADEREFVENYAAEQINGLKHYVGKKAVGRLGCYACHDVPGFDTAKPIGVALNDWGKKPADRLAFEDIKNYVPHHFFETPTWHDKDGKLVGAKMEDGGKKKPYEKFFYDDLMHEGRTGYLHQKILEPRSYDYGRIKAWDDRARMPQFRFARARRNAGESDEDFEARSWKEEADAREAVMAFILGLVAEPVPTKMTSQPRGDRLAEVKGRQVLDKFNCAGCHLLRPGAYDLQVTSGSLSALEEAYGLSKRTTSSSGMHTFPMHHLWTGKNPPATDRVVVPGVEPKLVEDEENPGQFQLKVRLGEALRFQKLDKSLVDIPASSFVFMPVEDLDRRLKSKTITGDDKELVAHVLAPNSPLGGQFADLMVGYLYKKDKDLYKKPDSDKKPDSGEARASLPPPLIGEGERVQAQWLLGFLRNPTPVRKMTILRMPKFNMSHKEAELLVEYFGAVERINNPGVGLYPNDSIPQQSPLDDPYWTEKNQQYLKRLQASGPKKDEPAWYKQRLSKYEEAFKQAAVQAEQGLQAEIDRAKQQKESLGKQRSEIEAKLKKAEGAEKIALEKQLGDLKATGTAVDDELGAFAKKLKGMTPEAYKTSWLENEAYAADAYRLIVNKQMCLQCHEVGGFRSSNPTTQGPPLAAVHQRLRPGWLYRWIATPQRHLTYESLMPVNFPKLKGDEKPALQDVFAGQPLEQVEAIRDVLMNYPRVVALPVNQQWNPNLQSAPPAEKK